MILFVDEERNRIKPWVDTVAEAGYACRVIPTVDQLFDLIETSYSEIQAIVLDIMMPPGRFDLTETDGGLRTGIVVASALKTQLGADFPIVVLSIRDDFNDELESIGVPCISKSMDTPDDLIAFLSSHVRGAQSSGS